MILNVNYVDVDWDQIPDRYPVPSTWAFYYEDTIFNVWECKPGQERLVYNRHVLGQQLIRSITYLLSI